MFVSYCYKLLKVVKSLIKLISTKVKFILFILLVLKVLLASEDGNEYLGQLLQKTLLQITKLLQFIFKSYIF